MSVEGVIFKRGEAPGVPLQQTRVDYLVTADNSKQCSLFELRCEAVSYGSSPNSVDLTDLSFRFGQAHVTGSLRVMLSPAFIRNGRLSKRCFFFS